MCKEEGYGIDRDAFERAMQEARNKPLPPSERRILEKLGTPFGVILPSQRERVAELWPDKREYSAVRDEAIAAGRANPDHCAYKIAPPGEEIPDVAFLLAADQTPTAKDIEEGMRLIEKYGWDKYIGPARKK